MTSRTQSLRVNETLTKFHLSFLDANFSFIFMNNFLIEGLTCIDFVHVLKGRKSKSLDVGEVISPFVSDTRFFFYCHFHSLSSKV